MRERDKDKPRRLRRGPTTASGGETARRRARPSARSVPLPSRRRLGIHTLLSTTHNSPRPGPWSTSGPAGPGEARPGVWMYVFFVCSRENWSGRASRRRAARPCERVRSGGAAHIPSSADATALGRPNNRKRSKAGIIVVLAARWEGGSARMLGRRAPLVLRVAATGASSRLLLSKKHAPGPARRSGAPARARGGRWSAPGRHGLGRPRRRPWCFFLCGRKGKNNENERKIKLCVRGRASSFLFFSPPPHRPG